MKKYLDLKGKNIINNNGNIIGTVQDCIIDYNHKRICSLIIYSKEFLSKLYMISYSDINKIKDYIFIKNEVYNMNKKIFKRNSHNMINSLIGNEVTNLDAKRLGTLMDIIFDEKDGRFKALICSRGFFENILEGRKIYLVDEYTQFYGDKIIVNEDKFEITNNISFKSFNKE